ncbi:MAG: hypothetical protein ACYDG0_07465 [Vulcanimicrobiaceae bacterium]
MTGVVLGRSPPAELARYGSLLEEPPGERRYGKIRHGAEEAVQQGSRVVVRPQVQREP